MDVELSCDTYARLAGVSLSANDDRYPYVRSLALERRNGHVLAIATNVKVAAIEYVGKNDGPDELSAIIVAPELVAVCRKEAEFNGMMRVVTNPALGFTTIKTQFGYVVHGNAAVALPPDNHFATWRSWMPDAMPKKSSGAMMWFGDHMKLLVDATITGTVKFPQFIDVTQPVVINDNESDKWIGLFLPYTSEEATTPAIIPDWCK